MAEGGQPAVNTDAVIAHEGAHSAAACWLGVPVRRVWVDGAAGATEYVNVFGRDGEGLIKRALVTLAGVIESSDWDEIPAWPVDVHSGAPELAHDRAVLADLIQRFRISKNQYDALVSLALRISLQPEFERTMYAVTGALSHRPIVDPDLFLRLRTLARGEAYG
jgi:hypothetical protein